MGTSERAELMHRQIPLPTKVRLHIVERHGSGVPVLCLHGIWGSWRNWLPLLDPDPCAFPGRPLVMLDLRGHGASDKPATGYALRDYAADTIALIEALGAPRVVLAGHSLGALAAIAAARNVPERIAALLLEDPPLPLPNDPFHLDPFWRSFAEVLFGLAAIKHRPLEEVVAQIREWLPDLPLDKAHEYGASVIDTADGVFAAITGGTFGGNDLLAPGPSVSIPTLLFQGAIPEQRGLQDSGVAALRAIFPNLTLVTIPDTGHSILEAAPAAYRQAVAAFFGDA